MIVDHRVLNRCGKHPNVAITRSGFSLIELMVVLAIMAIMASMTTLSIRGASVRQRLARGADVVERFDMALRRSARYQRHSVVGVIQRGRGRLVLAEPGNRPVAFQLPKQVSVDAIQIGSARGSQSSSEVLARADGSTASYAVRIASGGTHRWVFIAGGSGQVVHDLNDRSVVALLGTR